MWIPFHVGITGNEKADQLAKQAINEEIMKLELPKEDFKNTVKQEIKNVWNEPWKTNTNHLKGIKEDTDKWTNRENRRDQIVT